MRFALLAITTTSLVALLLSLPGCAITGSLEYTDPESGATASIGVNREFQPRQSRRPTSEHKAVKPIER